MQRVFAKFFWEKVLNAQIVNERWSRIHSQCFKSRNDTFYLQMPLKSFLPVWCFPLFLITDMSLIRAPTEPNKHTRYVFPPWIKRFHESVFKMRKRSRKAPHTRGQYSLVAWCYGKIKEISSNFDRIESNTCENYMLYMMEHVRKNSFPLDIFRAAVSWYFQPTKKLI